MVLCFMAINASASNWGMVGAGNNQCKNWNAANKSLKVEILSWMAGYSSAQNHYFASENQPEYRLKLLTYDYLTYSINSICVKKDNINESMLTILFGILKEFPRENTK